MAPRHTPHPASTRRCGPRRIVLVVYDGAQILDVSGPAAVFTSANRCSGERHYDVEIVSSSGEPVVTSGAMTVQTKPLPAVSQRDLDTLLVVGGDDQAVLAATRDEALCRWLRRAAPRARRYGSVCSGTFVLAVCGLVDGRRVATHWDGCAQLAQMFPTVQVDPEALYVVDGACWTSAGVTTGIDMALAMVEADVGAELAGAVAQRLVVYARRPGHQSQFSALLRAQVRCDAPYAELVEWMHANLERDLGVEALAKRCGQSPRDFHRKFARTTGQTPARFVENLRLDRVRALLGHDLALKEIAVETGFGSAVRMSRAFERRFGVKPSLFREMQPLAPARAAG
jgi:transcriptional regulator GlxA family with amidase domain